MKSTIIIKDSSWKEIDLSAKTAFKRDYSIWQLQHRRKQQAAAVIALEAKPIHAAMEQKAAESKSPLSIVSSPIPPQILLLPPNFENSIYPVLP
jgi:hypothetical protein